MHGVAGPDLAAVDHVLLAVADGRGLQVGQVRTALRLGVALAPHLLHAGDLDQVLVLLLVSPVLEQDGREHVQPVGVAHRHPPVGELLPDQHLVQRGEAPPPVLLGPLRAQPAVVEQLAVELPGPLELVLRPPFRREGQGLVLGREVLVQVSLQLVEHLGLLRSSSKPVVSPAMAATPPLRAPTGAPPPVSLARTGIRTPRVEGKRPLTRPVRRRASSGPPTGPGVDAQGPNWTTIVGTGPECLGVSSHACFPR